MAIIEPPLEQIDPDFHHGEYDTLEWLHSALPDDIKIFHSVEWLKKRKYKTTIGEVDFCILGPSGALILIEQKNGGLSVNNKGELIKHYQTSAKNPYKQLERSVRAIESLWRQGHSKPLAIHLLIYLPDYHVKNRDLLGFDSNCLIDASNKDALPELIRSLLESSPYEKDEKAPIADIETFFTQQFELSLDIGALIETQQRHYKFYDAGVCRTLSSLSFSPYHLLIEGPAGSGKTQIAMELFSSYLLKNKRPLYLCFNRPLAESVRTAIPEGGFVCNIDRFTDLYMKERAIYDHADHELGELLADLRDLANREPIADEWMFDALIVDEAQDLSEEQFMFARCFLRDDSPIVVMRDQMQNLYGKGFAFDATVSLALTGNYRCSQDVIDFTQSLLGRSDDNACGLKTGIESGLATYASTEQLLQLIVESIKGYLDRGYALADIAVLSGKGRERSELASISHIGDYALRKFTGDYTEDGKQIYTEGELEFDSIYRYKGRQKAVIILAELDFDEWSERMERLIYCGCTRARLELMVLMSEEAGACVLRRLL